VQRPAPAGDLERALLEQVLGSLVGQAPPPGDRTEVDRSGRGLAGDRPGRSAQPADRRSHEAEAAPIQTGNAASRRRPPCAAPGAACSPCRDHRRRRTGPPRPAPLSHTAAARGISPGCQRQFGERAARATTLRWPSSDRRGSRRRSSTAAGSRVSQPRRWAWAVKERSVATWRFHVAGAHAPSMPRWRSGRAVTPSRAETASSPWAATEASHGRGVGPGHHH
jgi:hypothetical protein